MKSQLGPLAAMLLGLVGHKAVQVYDLEPGAAFTVGALAMIAAYCIGRYLSPTP